MKLIAISFVLFIQTFFLFAQAHTDTVNEKHYTPIPEYRANNLLSLCSVGAKNTFGVWGVFVGHSFEIRKSIVEVRLGLGTKNSLVVGGGVDVKVCTLKHKIDFFVAGDYSYQKAGIIRYDDEKKYQPYTSDEYKVNACQYFHTYLSTRFFIGKDHVAALQFKTGYAFLLNDVSVVPASGPNVNYSRAVHSTESGIMLGVDAVFFLSFKDFKHTRSK